MLRLSGLCPFMWIRSIFIIWFLIALQGSRCGNFWNNLVRISLYYFLLLFETNSFMLRLSGLCPFMWIRSIFIIWFLIALQGSRCGNFWNNLVRISLYYFLLLFETNSFMLDLSFYLTCHLVLNCFYICFSRPFSVSYFQLSWGNIYHNN